MTAKKNDQDLVLTEGERQELLERRKRDADRQKDVSDSREAERFMVGIGREYMKLKYIRFEKLCADGVLSDATLERLLPELFGEGWQSGISDRGDAGLDNADFSGCDAILALIERTEPARRAKREAEAREIWNHPRDY